MEQIQVIFDMVEFQSMMWLLLIPVAMMGLDVLTGLINAFSKNQFESAKMRAGLAKKAGEMAIIAIGMLFTYGMGIPQVLLKAVSLYIVFMELMSICENLNKLGVPLPAFVTRTLHNIDETIKKDEEIKELKKRLEELEHERTGSEK